MLDNVKLENNEKILLQGHYGRRYLYSRLILTNKTTQALLKMPSLAVFDRTT